jgi:cysteinyl-tRNA synthetase
MTLRLHNTLTRALEAFEPLEPGHVRMYVCGITVYDLCHLGHARFMLVFDMVARWLRVLGLRVTHVQNITDVDDKIIRRAQERGLTIRELADDMVAAMHADSAALGIARPDVEPRATDHIPHMLSMIGQLVNKGLAYPADDGDVRFAVRRFAGYGKLSGKSIDDLRAGDRVAVNDHKNDPLDFVLWKAAKPSEPADAQWPSPYGAGRPGWHIECSAMSCAVLGERFDIHGGGLDLIFPHHENEIAQSEGALGHAWVPFWLHNGFVNIDDEKMSKSLDNFFTIREALKHFEGEVIRFWVLRTHYRSPLNFSHVHLEDARSGLRRLYTALAGQVAPVDTGGGDTPPVLSDDDWQHSQASAFKAAMNEDFNTPLALAALFELASEVNRSRSQALAGLLKKLAATLGLLQQDPRTFLQGAAQQGALDEAVIAQHIEQRAQAKKNRDFAQADQIRKDLAAQGVVLQDSPQGTTWVRA